MTDKREVYVDSFQNPNLFEHDFFCNGSDFRDAFPSDKGQNQVGLRLQYSTWNADRQIVDDASSIGMKGCRNFAHGECKIGSEPCPVAGVVDIKKFRARTTELHELKTLGAR